MIKIKGTLEVICGSMFSGKTEELIRRLKRADIAGLKTILFKPDTDIRNQNDKITSHGNNSYPSITVSSGEELLEKAWEYDVVGIDEVQFFSVNITQVCNKLAVNKRVIVAGLDMDFHGNMFGPMGELLATCNNIFKVQAVCTECGDDAWISHRITKDTAQILIGAREYTPLCRKCYNQL